MIHWHSLDELPRHMKRSSRYSEKSSSLDLSCSTSTGAFQMSLACASIFFSCGRVVCHIFNAFQDTVYMNKNQGSPKFGTTFKG